MSEYNPLSPVNEFRIGMTTGQQIEVTSSLQDTLAFEKDQRRPLVVSAGTVPLTSDLLWLAWHAACRESKTELRQFAAFAARVQEFEVRAKEDTTSVFDDSDPEGLEPVLGAGPTQDSQSGD